MAGVWADSFDWYSSSQFTRVYPTYAGFGTYAIVAGQGPDGSSIFRMSGDRRDEIHRFTPWASGATFIADFWLRSNDYGSTANRFLAILDTPDGSVSDGVVQAELVLTTSGTIRAQRGHESTASTLATSTYVLPLSTWIHFSVKVVIGNSGSISVKVSTIGDPTQTEVINVSGDTQITGAAQWTQFALGAVGEGNTDFAHAVICDGSGALHNDILGQVIVKSRRPASDSATHADSTPLSGAVRFAMIDDATADDDTTYNALATSGDTDTFDVENVDATQHTVLFSALVHQARKTSGSGAFALAPVKRELSTDYVGSGVVLSSVYTGVVTPAVYQSQQSGSAWTTATWNAVEWGYQSNETAAARVTQLVALVVLNNIGDLPTYVDGEPGPLTVLSFTDRSDVVRPYAEVDLNDDAGYYDGYKAPKLLGALPVRRGLTDARGQTQHSTFGGTIDDTSRELRALIEDPVDQYVINRPLVLRTVSDEDRRLELPMRVEMCGYVTAAKPKANLQMTLEGSDWLKKAVSRVRPSGSEFWQPLFTRDHFPRLPAEKLNTAVQIVYGRVSDEATVDPGIYPRDNADPGWREFGYNGWATGTLATQTYYVYMTTITNGVESMRYAFPFGFAANPSSPAFHIRFETAQTPDFYRIYLTDSPAFEPFTNPLAGTFARVLDIEPGDAPAGVNPYDANYTGPWRWYLIDNPTIGDDYEDMVTNGGSVPIVPPRGACSTQYAGEETIDDVTWSLFIVSRGACDDMPGVFLGGVRVASFGLATNVLAPFHTDFVTQFGANYRDFGGVRYTPVYLRESAALNAINGIAPLTVNVHGLETAGDTTGTLITSPVRIRQHLERNFAIPDAPPATLWLTEAPSLPIGTPAQNDASYDAAETTLGLRIAGGYECAGIVGSNGAIESLLDVFADLGQSGDFDAGIDRVGRSYVTVEVNAAPADEDVFAMDDVLHVVDGSFNIELGSSQNFWNIIPFSHTRDYTGQTSAGWLISGESTDAASVTNYEQARRAPQILFGFLRANTAQAIDTILDVVQRKRLRFRHPSRVVTLEAPYLTSADAELGDVLRLSHLEGTGASGWIDHDVRIHDLEVVPTSNLRRFVCYDLQPVYDGLDDAVEPTEWLNAIATTTLTQVQSNINDSSAGLAALSATVSALSVSLSQTISDVTNRTRVRFATTGNVTIATDLNAGDTIDGGTLVSGDLILLKNQTTAAQNGIYVAGVTPARFAQFDTYNEHPGTLIAVQEGTANADTLWLCTSDVGGTLGTTAIAFTQFTSGAASLPVVDTTAVVKGSSDATKLVRIEADGIATATTRVITMADQDVSLVPNTGTFPAAAHASRHQSGGADAIKLDDLAAPDDNIDLNVSITAHGLTPKAPNNTAQFLRGDGSWATVTGAGSGFGDLLDYQFFRKTSDESVTSSTAYQDDDHLVVPIGANETWAIDYDIAYTAGTAGDIKFAFNVPSGATGRYTAMILTSGAASQTANISVFSSTDLTDTGGVGAGGAGAVDIVARVRLMVVNGSTAGNVTLRWAQLASSATATTVLTHSYAEAKRVG